MCGFDAENIHQPEYVICHVGERICGVDGCTVLPRLENRSDVGLAGRGEMGREADVAVVEDEYQHSLRCRGDALPTLRSLDARGLTVTVSTVSKDLFPALRIGWVAGSDHLLQPMAAVKRFMDLETSPLLQAALVEFMRRGCFDNHLSSLLAELLLRHKALQAACAQHLPEVCRVTDPDGGFVAWLEMPNSGHAGLGQGEQLADLAAERGVRVVPGRAFDLDGAASRGVRLCLTRTNVDQIHHGVRVLGDRVAIFSLDPKSTRARGIQPDHEVYISFDQIAVEDIAPLQDELKLNPTAVESAYLVYAIYKDAWLRTLLSLEGPDVEEF
ncbi:MAG TPA: aminotransferase class I/II-fold pyridoxal phosphate-dependent enzyme, partial [Planctomycetes bacterium]|nr:aminotransferase class I/II-fold pyridoxal phosphate-dependent enzyme [Planctomycetota bacterium]